MGVFVSNALFHQEINTSKIESSSSVPVENVCIEINKHSKKYVIGGIYWHPNKGISEFSDKLDCVLHKIAN